MMDDAVAAWTATHAAAGPDRLALRCADECLTYGALEDWIRRLAAMLARIGMPPGARVAYLGANSPLLLALLFACARTGFVLVPLNWRLAPRELDDILADCTPALLCVEQSCEALAGVVTYGRAARHRAADWAAAALPLVRDAAPCAAGADTPVLLCYTSGTTGRPKGAVLTAHALRANAWNAQHMHDLTAADRVLTVLPMFHVGGLNIQTLPALRAGAEVVLLPRFEPAATLQAIVTWRPTLTVQVPATLQALQSLPAWATADLSSLRAISTGSTDVPRDLIDTWQARGVPVIQIYGATETGPVSIYQRIPEAGTVGTLGRCGRHTEIRLVRADGTDCAIGEPGEILVRGPHVISRYWRDANPEAFADGWFRTGDVAEVDHAGFYWFKDRLKNVIISGGENIYPAELERVLRDVRALREAAVIGRADATWGAVPVVVAVPADPAHDAGQLAGLVRAAFDGRLARYKHPRDVVIVDALPRTALGKIDVAALRARIG